jgi:hypothetical protein
MLQAPYSYRSSSLSPAHSRKTTEQCCAHADSKKSDRHTGNVGDQACYYAIRRGPNFEF